MCKFLSGWVSESGSIACVDGRSHSATQEAMGWDKTEVQRWHEFEWAEPGEEHLRVRLPEDTPHNESWYRAMILADYPTLESLVREYVRRAIAHDGRVNVSGATWLTSLSDLPACEELYCSGCTGLTSLPDLSACVVLDCSGCTGLTSLPDLPGCKRLYCSRCTGLTSPPDLSACVVLDCSDCTGLTSLPDLPACKRLYCSRCTRLELPPELRAIKR